MTYAELQKPINLLIGFYNIGSMHVICSSPDEQKPPDEQKLFK